MTDSEIRHAMDREHTRLVELTRKQAAELKAHREEIASLRFQLAVAEGRLLAFDLVPDRRDVVCTAPTCQLCGKD